MEKPFLLFFGEVYYASGGWLDFVGAFALLEEAISEGERRDDSTTWWHVVDMNAGKIVAESKQRAY